MSLENRNAGTSIVTEKFDSTYHFRDKHLSDVQAFSEDSDRMIYTGNDLIEIPRIAGVLERYPQRFLEKVFTEGEQRYARGRPHQLASRFAAKEAVMKLLGTGVRGVPWKSIEVTRKPGSPPEILLHGSAKARAEKMGITRIALSLSHSREMALATAVGEARDDAWKP